MNNTNVSFISLESLEKKIIPNKQKEIRINFGEIEQDTESGKEEQKPIQKKMSILDKRRTSNIDRKQILERLEKNNALIVKSELLIKKPVEIPESIPAPAIILPTSIKRKLVLKETGSKPVVPEELKEPEEQDQEPEPEEQDQEPEKIELEIESENEAEIDIEKELNEITQLVELKEPAVLEEDIVEKIIEKGPGEKPKHGRKPKQANQPEIIPEIDLTTAIIRTQKVVDRLPKEREKVIIKAPSYYMNNRKIFIQKLTELFKPYREDILRDTETASCDAGQSSDFDLLTHQKIVRDYLNLYTPYRGLLLYHGLGAGKTATSISIAEGMKSNKRVFVMTPASLKMNFFSEMKKFGDLLYKKNQFWEFVSIDGTPEYMGVLSRALSLSVDFIRKKGGAWLVNIQKEPNFTELSTDEQTNIDEQLNEMIRSKYTDINYNGLNRNKLNLLTGNLTRNPFDNSVVIIDEAHNFVSRIVNKIKSKDSISFILYDYLMKAENAKIVLLTGTPIINYPNEIGILFNILRGYIKSWTMTLNVKTSEKINTDSIITMLDKANLKTFDLVEYSGNKLTITRNPFGFINTKKRGVLKGTRREKVGGGMNKTKKNNSVNSKNSKKSDIETNQFAKRMENPGKNEYIEEDADVNKLYRQGLNLDSNPYQSIGEGLFKGGASEAFEKYDGVKLDESGNISDTDFINKVVSILRKNDIEIPSGSIETHLYKSLPDDSEKFLNTFVNVESGDARNLNLFQRRILGLTSYFRSAQEQLLPRFVKTAEGDNYHVVKSVMSNYQFGLYEKIRKVEADRERNAKKQRRKQQTEENVYNISSTYRIFSRAACNFVFPESIERPVPIVKEDKEISEATFDAIPIEQRETIDEYAPIGEEEDEKEAEEEITNTNITTYAKRIEKAMEDVMVKIEGTNESKYLSFESLETLSPKFAQIVKNISDPENVGLHLLYSHFRTIEGIGILKLILKANGFVEFKIKRNASNDWEIDDESPEENSGKPRFALYTGTETAEEKEIIRNVFNGMWDYIPASISKVLRENSDNNMYGEAIKLLMITSSGAEGINLRNTRFVHITEPYWHMPRVEQVIGRARRICSHQDLPEELRTVKVFLYITTLSEEQKTDEKNIELRIRDLSRIDKKTPVTTDETLYEIASLKQRINNQILQAVKESAVDCNLYSVSKNKEENLVCYGFGKVESNQFISYPSFDRDREEKTGLDVETIMWKAIKVTIAGIDYALNEDTMELYDFESYQRSAQSGVSPILIGRLINKKGRYEIVRV
jgi:hypothetical protein